MSTQALILTFSFLLHFFSIGQNGLAQDVSEKTRDKIILNKILRKSEQYCQKLEKGAFNFICQEEIVEKFYNEDVDQQMLLASRYIARDIFILESNKDTKKNTFLYEYK